MFLSLNRNCQVARNFIEKSNIVCFSHPWVYAAMEANAPNPSKGQREYLPIVQPGKNKKPSAKSALGKYIGSAGFI